MIHTKSNAVTWLRAHWLELLLAFVILGALTVSPASLNADDGGLPSGEHVLDGYVKATGSEKARDKLTNRVTVASMELAAQGIKLEMTIHSARPDRNYTVVESELTGKIERGSNGEVVWEMSDMMGAIPVTSYIGDYREVDGVKMPLRIRAVVMGQERVMITESIRHNVDLPADRFELPPAIRALLPDSASGSETKG